MYYFINSNFTYLAEREWLVTNGLGGYAGSTLAGSNSRRYHGLLVAAHNPPTDRQVLVSKLEETLFTGQASFELGSNQYGDVVHPQGWQYIVSFERLPLPHWVYQAGGNTLTKTVFMVQTANTTIVAYKNTGYQAVTLRLNPLFVCRDYHSLFHQNDFFTYKTERGDQCLKLCAHAGAVPVYWAFTAGVFIENRAWYHRFSYREEQQRGLDFVEDAFSVGFVEARLEPGEECFLTFSTDERFRQQSPSDSRDWEIKRIQDLRGTQLPGPNGDSFLQDLVVSANQFVVKRQSTQSETILAGYHWFTDWGRDTMIALRGLCISLGQQQTAQRILSTFFRYLDDGMLPNRFPDNSHDPVEYNTIDATLWLFVALYEYYLRFDDIGFIGQHFEQLLIILDAHKNGTRYGIHVTDEGLLYGGKGTAQLTWMDARVGDYVVTPRHGCPVEINALWYNALQITIFFAKQLHKKPDFYALLLRRFEESFTTHFWNEQGYLNDVVIPGGVPDASIRPNQIYALSLPFPLLNPDAQRQVLDTVERHLYTPYGLRTLSPHDPAFAAVYGGDQWLRDTAYHQGTVWPFLLGEYWSAYIRLHGQSETAKTRMYAELATLKQHFYEHNCVFGISEIFDGLHPKQGRGTANQAWSVGALIKLLADFPVR
ncbi:amylo-alpha-1,6-glucosidase [Fibrella aquatilis]|uniref:Glycogen debranching enzyme N-terminal domain-containing protein n=1 Tax=Fibrella aquatilis TaxID=2817059 RepID=A0A939K0S5_9BACT|nr:amylo-alpha-1,6-glucosidase [Fibrella aquatilis]MBO0932321.1 glycogen debranching enzyme N-terminal domain-containing protein [Fibrella aquatilis]